MATSPERFVFFLVILLGIVCISQGKQTFGTTNAFKAPQTSFGKRKSLDRSRSALPSGRIGFGVRSLRSFPCEQITPMLHLRGGEISIPDDDEDGSGIIVTKLRNILRSILDISDNKLPIFSGFLRTCFTMVESATGLSILPKEESSKKNKTKANGKNSKSASKKKKIANDDEKTQAKKKKPSKKKTSVPKKASTVTKKHLSTSIKSTNPNYRIQKELKAFIKSPPPNISVTVGANIRIWIVTLVGAKDTIYEGEVFKLRVEFPKDYPTVPPSVYFLKKYMPVHEHVYTNGDICLSLLGNGWRPTMSAQSIAVSILSILSSAQSKSLPMDNASHATAKPGQYQKDWVYHDDRC